MNSNKTVVENVTVTSGESEINRNSSNRINRAEYYRTVEADMAKSAKASAKRLKNKNRALENFAKVVNRAAQKYGITGSMKFDQMKSVIVFKQGDKTTNINLSKLHREYHAASPNMRHQVMTHYIDAAKDCMEALPQLFANFTDAKKHLMPLVRCRSTINENEHLVENYSSNWTPSVPFSSDASIILGTDMKNTIGIVQSKMLEQWGVSFDDAMKEAMANLRNRTAVTFIEIAPGVYRGAWHDDYDASCILLPDVIGKTGIVSDPIFMIPTKNCILMTAVNNVIGQWKMLEAAEKEMNKLISYVSTKFYRLQNDVAVEFVPDNQNVLDRLKTVKRIVIKNDYDKQQSLMRKANAREGIDIFVATYGFIRPVGTTDHMSFCAWAEDIKQWLPETDLIAMVMPKESQAEFDPFPKFVKWSDVVEILGNQMEKADYYPIRYLASGYPTVDQFEKLKSVILKSDK